MFLESRPGSRNAQKLASKQFVLLSKLNLVVKFSREIKVN